MKNFNGWNPYTITSFIPPVRYFSKVLSERILPAFNNFETETTEHYESWDDAVDEYCFMQYARQSMINLHAVGLRHLYEQQVGELVAWLFQDYQRNLCYEKDKDVLIDTGIDIKNFRSWNDLEELRYVCNTVKHAEGGGAKNLEKVRPDLFYNDFYPSLTTKRLSIRQPLAGRDISLQEKDIEKYAQAIENFWNEFLEKISA